MAVEEKPGVKSSSSIVPCFLFVETKNAPQTNTHTASSPVESMLYFVCESSHTDDSEGNGSPRAFTKL
ncbi:lipid phosphate phosphatase-related protein type 5-like protein [Lates japonicus]|uniref:Lipid phosphate phosphatase-related protein type 5-like protein n=1 Tax=Lates japonicus TaxID=270547 RepID=A0AAD3MW50_LATJO|nr:lipid phosphate phosphatase-related protein type 5-like protein [Lates japonicus]